MRFALNQFIGEINLENKQSLESPTSTEHQYWTNFFIFWDRWLGMFNPCFTEKLFTTFLSLIMKFFATSLCALVCLLGIPAIYQVSTTPGIFYV